MSISDNTNRLSRRLAKLFAGATTKAVSGELIGGSRPGAWRYLWLIGLCVVLLPAQAITGIMIYWGQQNWPIYFSALGGLPVLAPLHTAIAWLFSSFVVLHVYLVTTSGHTSMAAIKSMITGWEDIEQRPKPSGPANEEPESR